MSPVTINREDLATKPQHPRPAESARSPRQIIPTHGAAAFGGRADITEIEMTVVARSVADGGEISTAISAEFLRVRHGKS